ncbi:hypothetical protein ACIBM8_28950 [Micromonospora aurantiaca]|uniref:hypothetical protein n=1 Tax=Micromonospora aurantiaca (nom. illeg.) TaxID=47850 RepID=UPI003788FD1F
MLTPDLLVVDEELGNWEDTRCRVDLLAVDKDGHLVVIELQRTDDGGHVGTRRFEFRRTSCRVLSGLVIGCQNPLLPKVNTATSLSVVAFVR